MSTLAIQIKGLKEQRAAKISSMDTLASNLSSRAFTTDEKSQYEGFKKEVEDLNERVVALEEMEKRQISESRPMVGPSNSDTGAGEKTERSKIVGKYSLKRALNFAVNRRTADGVEAEFDVEQRRRMQEDGVSGMTPGFIQVPHEVLQKRDMDATTATAGPNNPGSLTVQTNVEGIIDIFLPEMVLGKLPVVKMNGLRGNVKFPQAQTLPSAAWETENSAADEKTPLFNSLSLSPKRLAAFIQLSNQLLIQSEANIQAFARKFLVQAAAIEFEKVCLKGGGSNEPTGIIGGSGYATVFAGDAVNNATNANGARLVWADWVKLVSLTKAANAPTGQAYVTSPAMVGRAQITPRQSAGIEGNFIQREYTSGINGFPVYATTNLPDTFTKGGSVALSAVIFGDFSNFIMASWGGVSIGVDPYTNMQTGLTNLVLESFVDCGMLNPAGFSVVKDAQSY